MDKERILELATTAQNRGKFPNPAAYGQIEDPDCHDVMEIFFDAPRDFINRIGYEITETACYPAHACASMVTVLAKDKPVLEAYLITAEQIAEAVGGLEKESHHCAQMAELALKKAIIGYSQLKKEQLAAQQNKSKS